MAEFKHSETQKSARGGRASWLVGQMSTGMGVAAKNRIRQSWTCGANLSDETIEEVINRGTVPALDER